MKAGEEGSTLAQRTARARGGEISGEHRSDTPRGPSVPWMAPSEIGLAPCEAYSPTYLAQALPDTIRLLRKRGAWEMNDHEDIAAQGERVRKILSLVKCLLTGEYPRPSTPERLLCFLSRAYWHPAASTHGTRALFARAAPHARGIAGPRRARFDPVPARPIDPRSTPGGRATRPRVTARGSPRALPPLHPVESPQPELRETLTDSPLPRPFPIPTAKKVKSDSEPSEVVPDVFLGSIGAAHNREVLQRLNITHVLTVAGGFEPKFPSEFTYECVDVKDVPEERLCVHFDRCLKFIAKCLLDRGRVLVHCFAGKSRSATICAAYVMATEGWTLDEALKAIGDARPAAAPNHGFMTQLASFERELVKARTEGRLLGRVQLDARRAASSEEGGGSPMGGSDGEVGTD